MRAFRAWRAWRQLRAQLNARRRGEGPFGRCRASALLARWRAARSARRALLARADAAAPVHTAAVALRAWRRAAWARWAATAALARSHPAWAVWRAARRQRGGSHGAILGVAAAAHWAAGGSAVAWRKLRQAGAAHRTAQSARERMRLRQVRGAMGRWGVRRAVGRARTRVRHEAWAWWRGRALRGALLRCRLGPRAEALRAREP